MKIFLKITNIMFCWRHVWPCNQTTKHLDAIKSNHIIHIFSAARLRSRWNFCKPPMRWHLGPTIELCMIIFLDGRVLSRNPTIWNPTRNLRGMWNPPQNCSNLFFVGVRVSMVALCFLCLKVWKCLKWCEKRARFAKVYWMIGSARDIPHTIHVGYL